MKFKNWVVLSSILSLFVVLETGCGPYRRGGLGIDVDIYSDSHYKRHRDDYRCRHGDHRYCDRHDRKDHRKGH